MSSAEILLSPLTIRLTSSVIYRHAVDLRSMNLVIDCPANALRLMTAIIYRHANDLQEMTLVIDYHASDLR